MDGERFGAILRQVAAGQSRRAVLTALAGGLISTIGGHREVAAGKCDDPNRPHHCKGGVCEACCKNKHCPGEKTCDDGVCSGTGGGGSLPVCAPPPYDLAGAGCTNTPTCTCTVGTTCDRGVCCIASGNREDSVAGYFCCTSTQTAAGVCCWSRFLDGGQCRNGAECCSGVCNTAGLESFCE